MILLHGRKISFQDPAGLLLSHMVESSSFELAISVETCIIRSNSCLLYRMAKAGADLVGVNCLFDPNILLEVMSDMKKSLDLFNLKPYLMVQPLGTYTSIYTFTYYLLTHLYIYIRTYHNCVYLPQNYFLFQLVIYISRFVHVLYSFFFTLMLTELFF